MPKLILIVDDSQVVRRLVRACLESKLEQVTCTEATDGLEAIEHVKKVKPDLIVLDASMPVMNGMAAAPVLHNIVPQAPIILFTLHKDILSEKNAMDLGIRAVVSKMDQIEVLVDQISNLTPIARATAH